MRSRGKPKNTEELLMGFCERIKGGRVLDTPDKSFFPVTTIVCSSNVSRIILPVKQVSLCRSRSVSRFHHLHIRHTEDVNNELK